MRFPIPKTGLVRAFLILSWRRPHYKTQVEVIPVIGQFTKEEAQECREALAEVMTAFPKSKMLEYFGHFNTLDLFLMAAEKAAPAEASSDPSKASA